MVDQAGLLDRALQIRILWGEMVLKKDKNNLELMDDSGASLSAMDRPIYNKKHVWQNPIVVGMFVIFMLSVFFITMINAKPSLTVDRRQLIIEKVKQSRFEDFISIRATVEPYTTVFLDAVEGGRVEKRLVDNGDYVEVGDRLVVLSNTDLLLSVTRNEALVAEQLNSMRNIELQLEKNRLQHKKNILDTRYHVKRLDRLSKRQEVLAKKSLISSQRYEETQDELEYQKRKLSISLESQKNDIALQKQQLMFIRKTAEQLNNNLALSRNNLENLEVKATLSGRLSGFNVEIGQSVERGGRLGQIDDPDRFKIVADIDEFYLNRIKVGQKATADENGRKYDMEVDRIYPQVVSGKFKVDFKLTGDHNSSLHSGQALKAKIRLGSVENKLILPNGDFLQDTGGKWVFALSKDGDQAVRKPVIIGRKNKDQVEIISGLNVDEEVIVSPYVRFHGKEIIKFIN